MGKRPAFATQSRGFGKGIHFCHSTMISICICKFLVISLVGQVVAAYYEKEKYWNRAIIEEINVAAENVKLYFVDYGNRALLRNTDIIVFTKDLQCSQLETRVLAKQPEKKKKKKKKTHTQITRMKSYYLSPSAIRKQKWVSV